MDYADAVAQKKISELEKKINAVYAEAERDIKDKLKDANEAYKVKKAKYVAMYNKGEITSMQLHDWYEGQKFTMDQLRAKKDQIAGDMTNANKTAMKMVNGETIGMFAFGANYEAYSLEHGAGVSFGFGLYDSATVTRLVRDDPTLLPKWKVNEKKDYKWNRQKIENALTQGIIQGEDLETITNRIASGLSTQNNNRMKTFARTAMTGAQNAGRYDRLSEAKGLGIEVVKQWMATLDGRTRDSHRDMDGEKQKIGDKWHPYKFSNGCRFPGDPEGPPREVYNCRCTLVGDLTDFPEEYERYDNIDGKPVDQMTYREWEEAKKPKGDRKQAKEEISDEEWIELERKQTAEAKKKWEELQKQVYATYDEENEIDNQMRELNKMEKLAQKDYSMFDKFDTKDDYNRWLSEQSDKISKLNEQSDRLVRPRRDDFRTEDEYDRAYDEYLTKKIALKEEREAAEQELYKMYNNDPGWDNIKLWRKGRDSGMSEDDFVDEYYELRDKKTEIANRREELKAQAEEAWTQANTRNTATLVDQAKQDGVEYREPTRIDHAQTTDEIVAKLAGGDLTEGSCASLAFCYVGQQDGYDVLDFRDGASRKMFSHECRSTLRGIARETGKPLLTESTNTGTGGAIKLLRQCEPGKEYYFVTGRHAAIVRRMDDHFEYMELQSGYKNGWKWLGYKESDKDNRTYLDRAFRNRFGSSNGISGEALMMDVNDMKGSRLLRKSYGYMNTAPDKQRKGAAGHER